MGTRRVVVVVAMWEHDCSATTPVAHVLLTSRTSDKFDALVQDNVHEGVEPFQHTSYLPPSLELHPHPLVEILLQVQHCKQ